MLVFVVLLSVVFVQNGVVGNFGDEVLLNFVNVDLDFVVKVVGQVIGKNFIVDLCVKGIVNFVIEKLVMCVQVLELLGLILCMQGYVIVEGNGFIKVVLEVDVKLQGFFMSVGVVGLCGGEQVVMQVFCLQYELVNNLVLVLCLMIVFNNMIIVYLVNNMLVIIDYVDNLCCIGCIIVFIDMFVVGEIELILLKNVVVIDVVVILQKLFDLLVGGVGGVGVGVVLLDLSLCMLVVVELCLNSVMVCVLSVVCFV